MVELYSKINQWSFLGEQHYTSGAVKIAHVPSEGVEAYMHSLIEPINRNDLEKIEIDLGKKLPNELIEFYLVHNGFHCFFDYLGMYGLRENYQRTVTDTYLLPFDIIRPNRTEWFLGLSKECTVFGYYGSDGSRVYLRPDGTVAVGCKEKLKDKVLMTWPSFEDWLSSEINRLNKLFDQNGVLMVNHCETLPFNSLK